MPSSGEDFGQEHGAPPRDGGRLRRWYLHWLSSAGSFRPSLPDSSHLRQLPATSLGWLKQNRYEILAVAAITAVGAFLRLYQLDGIPKGVHGDEALNVFRAQAILDHQWAGPYDPNHANGQPAGIEFWLAGLIALFGNGVVVMRLSMALLGVATLPLAYLLFRTVDGRATAIVGSSLLALSGWHLLLSRMAMSSVMPVIVEVLAALLLVLALRSGRWWLFALTGVALGLGVYTNNSYPFFLLGVAVLLVLWLLGQRATFRRALLGIAVLAAALFVTTLPFLSYAREHEDSYLGYARRQAIYNTSRYEEASGLLGRADVILDSGRDYVKMMVFQRAERGLPMLATPTSVLLGLGILYAARRWREPGIILAVILVFVIPWAGILTPTGSSGTIRKTVGVTPFIALLAALPLGAAMRGRYPAGRYLRVLALAATAVVVASVGLLNTRFYFDQYAASAHSKVNYPIVLACRYLNDLPGDPYVYFYSKEWRFDYVVRQYLAPDVEGEDRSGNWGSEFSLARNRSGDVVYVFLDSFREESDRVQRLIPGGHAFESIDSDGTTLFRAYYLPGDDH